MYSTMHFKFVIFVIIYRLNFFVNRIEAVFLEKLPFQSEPASIESFPWQVSVRLKAYDMPFPGDGHICGGSVISQRVVLSAAHCIVNEEVQPDGSPDNEDLVEYRSPDEFILIMGTESLSEISRYTLQYQVLQLTAHEAFNLATLVNNIAMFFINDYIPWNWPTVRAVPLNTMPERKGTLCNTSGWNITEDDSSDILRGNLVPIMEQSVCKSIYGDLTSDLLCAGYEEEFEHAFCDGDSGGPLVCLGHLTGIILEGNSCARSGYPGLYVNVLYHYNWIVATNKTFNYSHYDEYKERRFVYHQTLENHRSNGGSGQNFGLLKVLILCALWGVYLE